MSEIKPKDIQHEVNNLVITCSDHRFQRTMRKILDEKYKVDIERSDRIALPGASKAIADGTLIPYIQTLHLLHYTKNVYVVDHTDCGGFGSLEHYGGDEAKETQSHFESLDKAKEAIHNVLPQLVVISFVVTLNGEAVVPKSDNVVNRQ